MDIEALKALLIQDEGIKFQAYLDTKGNITIGVGRNIKVKGISNDEAMLMLANDIFQATKLANQFPWFQGLSNNRQLVIVSMIFNMGYVGFLGFHKMIEFLAQGNFNRAAFEMQNSSWSKQVDDRAKRLSDMMSLG